MNNQSIHLKWSNGGSLVIKHVHPQVIKANVVLLLKCNHSLIVFSPCSRNIPITFSHLQYRQPIKIAIQLRKAGNLVRTKQGPLLILRYNKFIIILLRIEKEYARQPIGFVSLCGLNYWKCEPYFGLSYEFHKVPT